MSVPNRRPSTVRHLGGPHLCYTGPDQYRLSAPHCRYVTASTASGGARWEGEHSENFRVCPLFSAQLRKKGLRVEDYSFRRCRILYWTNNTQIAMLHLRSDQSA